jgi:hypothetical protein
VALLGALAGCSSTSSKGKTVPESMNAPTSIAPSPEPNGDVPRVTLPIQSYEQDPSTLHQLNVARLTLLRACMLKQGFDYPPASSFPKDTSGVELPADAFRYGPLSATEAKDGYRFATDAADKAQAAQVKPPAPTAAEAAVLHGVDNKSGCSQEAISGLTAGGGAYGEPDLVSSIDSTSFQKSQSAPPMTVAFKKWSTCMSGMGFTYATPIDAVRDPKFQSSKSPTPNEIATAEADVDCKAKVNLVGTWIAVETDLQNQAINQNAEALKKLKDGLAITMRNVASVIH